MYPISRGRTAYQAHVHVPEGLFEEEHGRDAFSGPCSHLYRRHPPTAWDEIEGPLKPRAFDLNRLASAGGRGWMEILRNPDCAVYVYRPEAPEETFLRDADGDITYFVHNGAGTLESDYGDLAFEAGDYVVVPKGTTHRLDVAGPCFFLVIETHEEIALPDRGLLGQHALFDPAVLVLPELKTEYDERPGRHVVRAKRDGQYTDITYRWHPIDVVGWRGTLTVRKLNVRDFRPITSPRYHLPPSVHATFVVPGLSICTFAPRPLEGPETMRVPFYHNNIDNDEVLFYHRGNFFSRAGIDEGYMTVHPQGLYHGPAPAAVKGAATKTETDEVAVMLEAEHPFEVSEALMSTDLPEYGTSWKLPEEVTA
ncbi:MAG: homogentisate 1,2-dioxygenase [Candidatus Dormibacteria bacterium]